MASKMQGELFVFKKSMNSQHGLKTNHSFNHSVLVNMAQGKSFIQYGPRPFTSTRFSPNQSYYSRGTGTGRGRWTSSSRQICQICGRMGHYASTCYHRFDKQFGASQ